MLIWSRAADVTDIAVIEEPVEDKPVLPHDNAILAQGVSLCIHSTFLDTHPRNG